MLSKCNVKPHEDKKRMKRLGNIWNDAINVELVVSDIIDGTKHKRGKRETRKLLFDKETVAEHPELWHQIDKTKAEAYAKRLVEKLEAGTWEHQPPRHRRQYCRNKTHGKGKWRNLSIPCLDDHIVAHIVMRASEKAFTKGMHPHCCGSVPGRGIKHVYKTVKRWMQGDRKCRYFVKLDIRHFFENIDAGILKKELRKRIKDKKILAVFDKIIDSDEIACPVGYYTSPWFANLLLQDFDWFVEQALYKERRGKRIKYVRHYLRYVDDMLLIGTCKGDMVKAIQSIQAYLMDRYGLEIKNSWEIKAIGKHEVVDGNWQLKPGTYWCDIGGYKFCKDSVILRDEIYLGTKRLAKRMYKKKYYTLHECQSLNSMLGWASHCDSKRFVLDEIEPYVSIDKTRKVVSTCGQKQVTVSRSGSQNTKNPATT